MKTDSATVDETVFDVLLASLNITTDHLEQRADQEGYRIQFEGHFCIEIEPHTSNLCRISARLCKLAGSLEIQERQLEKALSLFSEIENATTPGYSLAVSRYDNCLRLVCDLEVIEMDHCDLPSDEISPNANETPSEGTSTPGRVVLPWLSATKFSLEDDFAKRLGDRFEDFIQFAYAFKKAFLS